jgi:hypothetical protein
MNPIERMPFFMAAGKAPKGCLWHGTETAYGNSTLIFKSFCIINFKQNRFLNFKYNKKVYFYIV